MLSKNNAHYGLVGKCRFPTWPSCRFPTSLRCTHGDSPQGHFSTIPHKDTLVRIGVLISALFQYSRRGPTSISSFSCSRKGPFFPLLFSPFPSHSPCFPFLRRHSVGSAYLSLSTKQLEQSLNPSKSVLIRTESTHSNRIQTEAVNKKQSYR